jgi:adsorption protein B
LLALGIARFRPRWLGDASQSIPNTAVFIANWREEGVLGRMVEGNLARIQIPEISLYLGVYPNDTATLGVAKALEAKHPDRVRVIVNRLSGPTSKGQMLK